MSTCKTISFFLAKGGTTKTTSTINIGAAHPQGNLSVALGLDANTQKHTLAAKMLNVLDDSEGPLIEDCLIHCNTFDLLPSNQKLRLVEKRLTMESGAPIYACENELNAELTMKKALEPLRSLYDYVLIDCAPSLGLLTINALAASDGVLLPMEAHFLGFDAIKQTLDLIARVKTSFNQNLTVEGILLTKYQDRTTLCRSIRNAVQQTYGETLPIFPEPIPYSIKAAEQSVCGASIFETDPNGKIAAGYRAAASHLEVAAHG